jgi:hypothetical protein
MSPPKAKPAKPAQCDMCLCDHTKPIQNDRNQYKTNTESIQNDHVQQNHATNKMMRESHLCEELERDLSQPQARAVANQRPFSLQRVRMEIRKRRCQARAARVTMATQKIEDHRLSLKAGSTLLLKQGTSRPCLLTCLLDEEQVCAEALVKLCFTQAAATRNTLCSRKALHTAVRSREGKLVQELP